MKTNLSIRSVCASIVPMHTESHPAKAVRLHLSKSKQTYGAGEDKEELHLRIISHKNVGNIKENETNLLRVSW